MTPDAQCVTVISVTFNSAALICDSLSSAQRAAAEAGLDIELVVVDNASSDGSAALVGERFPTARVISNETNVGFARANNQAFEAATGDVWLLLNPDATLAPDALTPLVRFLGDNASAGAAAPSISPAWTGGPESGGMRPSIRSMVGHFFLLNRLLPDDRGGPWRGLNLRRRAGTGPRPVEWASAAALLLKPQAVRDVKGFDERFFLYGEDLDLGDRLRDAGWEIWIVPGARAAHLFAGSQERVSTRWVDAAHDYYLERSTPWRALAFDTVFAVGLTTRACAARLRDRTVEGSIRAHTMDLSARRAWALAGRGLLCQARVALAP